MIRTILSILTSLVFFGNAIAGTDITDIYLSQADAANKTKLELEAFSEKKLGKLTTKVSSKNIVYTFEVQGTVDDNNKKGTFADLDGLKNGTKVTFGFKKTMFSDAAMDKLNKLHDATEESCKPLFDELRAIKTEMDVCRAIHKIDADSLEKEADKEALYKKRCEAIYKKQEELPGKCSEYAGFNEYIDKEIKSSDITSYQLGATLSLGSERFKWVDPTSLESDKDTKSSYSAAVEYSYITSAYSKLKIGYRYEEKWSGKDAQQLCTPYAPSPGSLTCNNIAIGAPTETTSKIPYIEWKQYFWEKDKFAFSTRISHDTKSDLTGLDIPIYLYGTKKDSKLQGGLRLGWVSDTDTTDTDKDDSDVIFSIFINGGFNINN